MSSVASFYWRAIVLSTVNIVPFTAWQNTSTPQLFVVLWQFLPRWALETPCLLTNLVLLLHIFLILIYRGCVLLQLDCPSDAHSSVIITFALEVGFQIRDLFWIPQPKLHGACYLIFLQNLKTGFSRFLLVFFFYLVSKRWFPGSSGDSIGPLSSQTMV